MNKKRGKRPIIVHMGSRYKRNQWLLKYRQHNTGKRLTAKDVSKNFPDAPIYLSEHLTGARKMILKSAKEFARENGIKYVWVKDGYVLMKKNDNDKRVQKISTMEELEDYKEKHKNFTTQEGSSQ